MTEQKSKYFFSNLTWFSVTVIIVIMVSFTLEKINDYFQNQFELVSVQASTVDTRSTKREEITQVSSFLKQGYVGNYFTPSPFEAKTVSFNSETQIIPKVLGVRIEKKPYQAELVRKTTSVINIAPGKRITFEAQFKNTGTATWKNSDAHFIALNVTNPPGRKSNFRDIFWPKDYRPAIMKTKVVRPGEIGLFRFALTAPTQKDEYSEKFGLVAENLTWISGGDLEIAMRVGNPKPHFRAKLVGQAYQEITIEPGKAFTFWADFKNTGSQTWYRDREHFVALNVTDPTGRTSAFRHIFWPKDYRPAIMKNKVVKPGEVARFEFALQAAETIGSYTERFGLVAENLTWISGGKLEIPINVAVEPEPVTEIQGEPDIRIGLYPTSSEITITANGSYKIKNTENTLIESYAKDVVSEVNYNEGKYTLVVNQETIISELPLRFIPQDDETIMEIANFENLSAWNQDSNDNRFRGILEIRYAENTERLWVINELPLESYLRGVAEATNENDEDYLKALMIAARSYAMYHIQTNTKHDDENYIIDATYDQVYRGYGFELRSPNVTQAILGTEGIMVTYENEVVVTPYFSRADGRTRSWEEVWSGGPYPWLITVSDPWSEGDTLWGHGVGMPAESAREQAEEGKTYEEILKFYYTGVDLEKIY